MKPPSASHIYSILRILDWRGHIELGDRDISWLAQELAVAFSIDSESDLCEVCETIKPIVVKTNLGRICEDCLESLGEQAEELRELWEEE